MKYLWLVKARQEIQDNATAGSHGHTHLALIKRLLYDLTIKLHNKSKEIRLLRNSCMHRILNTNIALQF